MVNTVSRTPIPTCCHSCINFKPVPVGTRDTQDRVLDCPSLVWGFAALICTWQARPGCFEEFSCVCQSHLAVKSFIFLTQVLFDRTVLTRIDHFSWSLQLTALTL